MGNDFGITSNNYISQYSQNGQRILDECRKRLQQLNIPMTTDKKGQTENKADEPKKNNSKNKVHIHQRNFSQFSNPANRAYTKFLRSENNFIKHSQSSAAQEVDLETIVNAGRIIETMESIDDAGKRHLSFLTEEAPESGNISGGLNGYYESGTDERITRFLIEVTNCWQNKNKNIYTRFNATIGSNAVKTDNEAQESQNKIIGNISFDGRLDRKNFVYGAGVDYNSYSNAQILDIHAAGKHKQTGLGADITRRTVITKNEEGEQVVISNMKLKLDILSNKNDGESNSSKFSFDTDSSALPSEVENVDKNAKQLASEYIKPDRKNGFDVDFEYDENRCGITSGYNYNLIDKENKFLSIAPVAGLHDYTDQTIENNNEAFQFTGGLISQFGIKTTNGQTFTGSLTGIADRIVQKGSRPSDSHYLLANFIYDNSRAKFNAQIDAGLLKSGDISLQYINLNAEKELKNSSITVNAGIAKFKMGNENNNLFNITASYKYNIPYKTKK